VACKMDAGIKNLAEISDAFLRHEILDTCRG
jgi:hypothetical protein